MRNLKKILALVLSLMMVLSVMVTASAADYSDADDIQYTEAVEVMSALGILSGADGKFVPQGTLYRDQAAKIIAYIKLGADADALLKGTGSDQFVDVTGGWAYDYVSYCANEGIINGYTVDGKLHFGPGGTLTGYQFGKMVLNAAGVEGNYTGAGWELRVATALKDSGLLDNMAKDFVLSANITREQACQLAFNAMTYGPIEIVTKYEVMGITDSFNSATGTVNGNTYLTKAEAIAAAAKVVVSGSTKAKLNEDYVVEEVQSKVKDLSNSLIATAYGASMEETTDAYGRSMNVWTATKVGPKPVVVEHITEAPILTYDKPVSQADLYAALGLKATLAADKITVLVDNFAEGVGGNSYGSFTVTEKGTAKLGVEGQAIEVYKTAADAYKAILVSSIYGTVTSVDKTAGTVTVGSYAAYKATGYEVGDHVLLTAAKKDATTVVTGMEKVETFTGTLTSYTNSNVFTISGKAYEVSAIPGTNKASTVTAIQGTMGVEKLYGVDKAGRILYVTTPTGDAPIIPTNYAKVLDVNVTVKTSDEWLASTTTVAAQILVLLSDGTAAVWDVPVAFTETGIDSISANNYYVTVAGTKTALGVYGTNDNTTASAFKSNLSTALANTIYTYADEALVSAVAAFTGNEDVSGAVLYTTTAEVKKDTYAASNVIFNNNTVFVLYDTSTGKIVVKTGLAALENTTVATGSEVVVDVTYDGKDTANNVNVAKVVFADGVFTGATAVNTTNYVLLDSDYTTTMGTEGPVYTYTYTKVDGTKGTVAASANLAAGVYVLKTDGKLNESAVTSTKSTIGIVSGTTVYVGDTAMTTTDKTVVVGGELVKGAKAYVVSTSNVISLVFVVE